MDFSDCLIRVTDPKDPEARWAVAMVSTVFSGIISYHFCKEHAELTQELASRKACCAATVFSIVRDANGNIVLPSSLATSIANFVHLPTEG